MNVISLKDYAKQNNISYEAVRQQVVRYKDDLAEHIIRDGRQQFLDEDAVAFLDSKRQKNPVAIIQMDKDEQIEALRREKENLLIKVAEQADIISRQATDLREADKALGKVDQLLLSAKEDKERAEALAAQNADLSAERERAILKASEAEKEALEARMELERKAEAERLLAERAVKAENGLLEAKKEFEDKEYLMQQEIEQLRNRKWWQLLFKK